MIAKAGAAIIALLFLSSLIFVGVVAAAFAIDDAFATMMGPAGAAALTALIFLIIPIFALLVFALRRPRESVLMSLLSSGTSPLAAILGAGALGLAETFLRKRRRRD